jgi:hypothetical protein
VFLYVVAADRTALRQIVSICGILRYRQPWKLRGNEAFPRSSQRLELFLSSYAEHREDDWCHRSFCLVLD